MQRARVSDQPAPKESEEQANLFTWAAVQKQRYPGLELMYHVPNGGYRNAAEAARLKAQGVKSGVPDICLPVARGSHHGLYIELKRRRCGRISDAQTEWMERLAREGYAVALCEGWDRAADVILRYLEMEEKR